VSLYSEVDKCRICGNSELDPILDLGFQALSGIFPRQENQHVPSGPLQLVKCHEDSRGESCGLVQLAHTYDPNWLYGTHYGYRSGLNQSMVDHLWEMARKIKERIDIGSGDLILDIGSNDGTLLRAMNEPGATLTGMDPTGGKFHEFYPPHVQLITDFFSAERFRREFGERKAKVVTSIAMFYDLEAPIEFMQQVCEVLRDDGIWVFEQSYLPTMIKMNSYDTVCHEHLEYYRLKQVQWMADRAGLKILDVELNAVNGGSFAVTVGKAGSPHPENVGAIQKMLAEESSGGFQGMEVYAKFRESALRHQEEFPRFLGAMARRSKVLFGYGASTKGNVMLQFCGINKEQLPYIAEVNPDKFGCFTPQTRIPIISEQQAGSMKPDGFVVLPWHYRESIVRREHKFLESGGTLIFPLPTIDAFTHA
jgi:NDP-4-keto-2,6-dideoxyhexose 3-C-methyltransferase